MNTRISHWLKSVSFLGLVVSVQADPTILGQNPIQYAPASETAPANPNESMTDANARLHGDTIGKTTVEGTFRQPPVAEPRPVHPMPAPPSLASAVQFIQSQRST